MRSVRVIVVLVIATLSLAVGVARAGDFPPKTVPSGIIFNKQIGGAKLGMTYRQAIKAWGEQGDCKLNDRDDFCFYNDDESSSGLRFKKGVLWSIDIGADAGKKGGFVREFKFEPNIGIGATRAQVRASFKQFPPKGKVALDKKVDTVTEGKRSTALIYTGDRLTTIVMYLY
ncbi:MAG: hypothetical protein WKF94_18205 [Solirubrobacteraceae bacterium]